MNKNDLVDEVSAAVDLTKTATTQVVDAMIAAVVRAVANGETVTLSGFGTFERRHRRARVGRNPRSGQRIPIAATDVPAFRPAPAFRDAVAANQ